MAAARAAQIIETAIIKIANLDRAGINRSGWRLLICGFQKTLQH
jgi:hypothetical protein